MGCAGCGDHQSKFGNCVFCINANLIGAVSGWAMFIVMSALYPGGRGAWLSLAIASFFTIIFMAHMIAWYRARRAARK